MACARLAGKAKQGQTIYRTGHQYVPAPKDHHKGEADRGIRAVVRDVARLFIDLPDPQHVIGRGTKQRRRIAFRFPKPDWPADLLMVRSWIRASSSSIFIVTTV
jgi:hypothetical protein